jgi:hypothetical protein
MIELLAEVAKSVIADDVLGPKVLELCGIGPSLSGQRDQRQGASQITIVVCRDIGDEVSGLICADKPVTNFEFGQVPTP